MHISWFGVQPFLFIAIPVAIRKCINIYLIPRIFAPKKLKSKILELDSFPHCSQFVSCQNIFIHLYNMVIRTKLNWNGITPLKSSPLHTYFKGGKNKYFQHIWTSIFYFKTIFFPSQTKTVHIHSYGANWWKCSSHYDSFYF